ncbi:Rhodocoxin reductase [Planctomycetes bacterium MalM25]|nr:Rhodocoxin reductase [Planctomycetes bacterium MalM25]
MSGPHCVVVGAGHAAAQLCASLVQAKWPGRVTVIGDEPHAPYHRPPLSKTQLDASREQPLQAIRPDAFYDDNGIELLLGNRVDAIDRDAKHVRVGDRTIDYDALVLATGSTHHKPPIAGVEHPRVLTLQTAQQAAVVRRLAADAHSAVIIGAGFIGLEVASSLRKLRLEVTVLELAERVLSRVTCPEVSAFFARLHRDHGVDLRTGVAAEGIEERGGRLSVATKGGDAFPADFVVIGAGATPNVKLALDAGLEVDNGVVVNEFNQTSDPAVYAVGDCCNQHQPRYGARMRLESVQNANDQAKTVAAALAGEPRPHDALPWFWSDQYDVKLQIAGVSTGYDQLVLRGDPESGPPFSAWYLKDGRLLAVDAINDPRAYAVASRLIPARKRPDLAQVADPGADLKMVLNTAQES